MMNNQSKFLKILAFGIVLLGATTSILFYKLIDVQQTFKNSLENLTKKEEEKPEKKQVEVIEKIITKIDPWSDVQPKLKDSVVQVFSHIAEFNWLEPYKTPNQSMATGTGFFINDQGYIITNAHVVNQAKSVSIQVPSQGKEQYDVEIVGICFDRDLALCKVKAHDVEKLKSDLGGRIPYLKLGDSNKLLRGNEVMVVGFPLGQQSIKTTRGIVSGRQSIIEWHRQLIQIDAAINPGNSGGPAINLAGEVIGVATGNVPAAQNVGYIIPVHEVNIILDDLHKAPGKLLRKPFLGIFYNSGNAALTKFLKNPPPGGCYVTSLYKGSLLDKVGVKPGDMIYEINGHSVDTFGEVSLKDCDDKISLIDYISFITLNSEISLAIYRKGERKEFKFKFNQSKLPQTRVMYPDYEKIDFETIGGLVVMQLSRNHLPLLISLAPELIAYEEPKNQTKSVLIVTHIHADSQAQRSRVIIPGSRIKEVNGVEVTSLEEFRKEVKNSLSSGFLALKFYNDIFTVFPIKKVLEDEMRLPYIYRYPVTPFVQDLMKEFNKKNEKETGSTSTGLASAIQ